MDIISTNEAVFLSSIKDKLNTSIQICVVFKHLKSTRRMMRFTEDHSLNLDWNILATFELNFNFLFPQNQIAIITSNPACFS